MALDLAIGGDGRLLDPLVAAALVRPLGVVVLDVLGDGSAQRRRWNGWVLDRISGRACTTSSTRPM